MTTPKKPKGGRPPLPADHELCKTYTLTLPPSVFEQARRIGEGNASEGVRRAVRGWKEKK